MSKAERISQRIDGLEAEYRSQLIAALAECAGGYLVRISTLRTGGTRKNWTRFAI